MLERAKRFYHEHEPACTAAFFAAGFLFDAFAVGRIDETRGIIQQGLYLLLCGVFTGLELREHHGTFTPPERLKTAWRYHEGATHFMLGTLLNIYTLFYFKSASLSVSFLFMLFLAGLLAVNELKPFDSSGTMLRMSLLSLCLVSYFGFLVPVLAGAIGPLPFLGSLLCASAAMAALGWWLNRRLPTDPSPAWTHVAAPFGAVALVFTMLYAAKLIPPVPLSLSEIGVYHGVRREGGRFALTSTRPRWRFWERGDQTFLARPGDALYCYVSVFSPGRFTERLTVRWLYKDPDRGWREADGIPLDTVGGRDEGWRGFTAKSNYKPGAWRVRVETSDGRELGRIGVAVAQDTSSEPRAERTLWR